MRISEMREWITTEYAPLELSLEDATIDQLIKNAIRYFNTNSAVKYVEMVDLTGNRTRVSKYMKAVSQAYPASGSTISNAYEMPMWTLLGVQVINALNTDLIMLSETYKSMSIYMGKDFQWSFLPADDPKNLVESVVRETVTGMSGILANDDLVAGSVTITRGVETFTDDGLGALVSNNSFGTNGTISYLTGAWAIPSFVDTGVIQASYSYTTDGGGYIFTNRAPDGSASLALVGAKRVFDDDDITEHFTLDWILRYSFALVKAAEGNVLRKGAMINCPTDGQAMIDEAKEEIAGLKDELCLNGRWLAFGSRI